MIEAEYKVDWTESEKGWGQKYSHSTYYDSKPAAEFAIQEFWREERKANPSGKTPDYYIFPSKPYLVEKE